MKHLICETFDDGLSLSREIGQLKGLVDGMPYVYPRSVIESSNVVLTIDELTFSELDPEAQALAGNLPEGVGPIELLSQHPEVFPITGSDSGGGEGNVFGDLSAFALLMHFDGDETLLDDELGHDVIATNPPAKNESGGQFGGCAVFDGVNDSLKVTSAGDCFPTPGEPWMIELWFKPGENHGQNSLVTVGRTPDGEVAQIGLIDDRLRFTLSGNGNRIDADYAGLTEGQWHYAKLVHFGNSASVYLNNVELANWGHSFTSEELEGYEASVYVGVYDPEDTNEEESYFAGEIDEVAIRHAADGRPIMPDVPYSLSEEE